MRITWALSQVAAPYNLWTSICSPIFTSMNYFGSVVFADSLGCIVTKFLQLSLPYPISLGLPSNSKQKRDLLNKIRWTCQWWKSCRTNWEDRAPRMSRKWRRTWNQRAILNQRAPLMRDKWSQLRTSTRQSSWVNWRSQRCPWTIRLNHDFRYLALTKWVFRTRARQQPESASTSDTTCTFE